MDEDERGTLGDLVRPNLAAAREMQRTAERDGITWTAYEQALRMSRLLERWPPALAVPSILSAWLWTLLILRRAGVLLLYVILAILAGFLGPVIAALVALVLLIRWGMHTWAQVSVHREMRPVLDVMCGLDHASLKRIGLGYEPTEEQVARALRRQRLWRRQSTP